MHKVLIPEANKKDLVEIPKYVQRRLKFVAVRDMDQVLTEALARSPFQHSRTEKAPKKRLTRPATARWCREALQDGRPGGDTRAIHSSLLRSGFLIGIRDLH